MAKKGTKRTKTRSAGYTRTKGRTYNPSSRSRSREVMLSGQDTSTHKEKSHKSASITTSRTIMIHPGEGRRRAAGVFFGAISSMSVITLLFFFIVFGRAFSYAIDLDGNPRPEYLYIQQGGEADYVEMSEYETLGDAILNSFIDFTDTMADIGSFLERIPFIGRLMEGVIPASNDDYWMQTYPSDWEGSTALFSFDGDWSIMKPIIEGHGFGNVNSLTMHRYDIPDSEDYDIWYVVEHNENAWFWRTIGIGKETTVLDWQTVAQIFEEYYDHPWGVENP